MSLAFAVLHCVLSFSLPLDPCSLSQESMPVSLVPLHTHILPHQLQTPTHVIFLIFYTAEEKVENTFELIGTGKGFSQQDHSNTDIKSNN